MKSALLTTILLSFLTLTCTVSIHQPQEDLTALSLSSLGKRRGGGGSRGGSSGGKTGGKTGTSASGRPISSYSFSSASTSGGRTRDGSGPPPPYNGRYAGGALVPYTAGKRSPSRNIAPYALPITAFAFFPGIWLYGSLYAYPYPIYYHWNNGGRNETANVTCLCQRYSVCGCDPNDNTTFVQRVVGNGTSPSRPVNTTDVRYFTYANGTNAAFINGTLPNGTTASGGTEPSNADEISEGAKMVMSMAGYWALAVTVVEGVMGLG